MTIFDHDYQNFPELTNAQMQVHSFTSPHPQITRDFLATVVKVHDGDTVTLRTDFRDFDFPLRLLDIDAPEMNAGGEVTQQWLHSKLINKDVQILIDSQQRVGKYGRLLGKIFLNGLDVGQEEIFLGLAVPFGKKDEGGIPKSEKVFMLRQWF